MQGWKWKIGVAQTFRSMISLFLASNSFFAGSSASALFPSAFSSAASPSFFTSGSVEYHLDVAGLDDGAKDRLDCLNCGRANDDLGAVLMLELNALDCRSSVLGIMVESVLSRDESLERF